MLRGLVATAALVAGLAGGASARVARAAYRLSAVPLPGNGRGDYITVDHARGKLYVTHSAVVHILDLATLKLKATLTGLNKAHGVAIDEVSGRGFATDGGANTVVIFDTTTGARIKDITVGLQPRQHRVRSRVAADICI